MAKGQMAAVKHEFVPVGLKLHPTWGPVEVQPQVFPLIPEDDNTLILGRITLRMLGIFPNAELDRIARGK